MRRLLFAAFTICTMAAAQPAVAQSADPTAHRHLGLFLQFDAGPGYLSSKAGLVDAKLYRRAADLSFSVGGALYENCIVAGHFWGTRASSPNLHTRGQSLSTSDSTLTLAGIGVDLIYYLMPVNVYLAVSPGMTRLSLKVNGVTGNTDYGLGLRMAVGKEWWVSDHWGIGVNGHLVLATNKDKGDPAPTWDSYSAGVAFSATYN